MKAFVVAAAVSGMAGTAAGALNLSFQTVLDGSPTGNAALGISGYSVGTGGQVAAVVQEIDLLTSGMQDVVLYRPAGAASINDVEIAGSSTPDSVTGLSLVGDGKVTWYDQTAASLMRYQDGQPYVLHTDAGNLQGDTEHTVNAAGQVAYRINDISGPILSSVVRFEIQGGSVLTTPLADNITPPGFASTPQITSTGNVLFMHEGTDNYEIHDQTSWTSASDPWVGQLTYSNGGTNSVTPHVINSVNDDLILFSALAADSTNRHGVYLHVGPYESPTYYELYRSDKDPDQSLPIHTRGMVTPGGRVAVSIFDDSASATSIVYWENGSRYELTETDLQGLGISGVTTSPMVSDGLDHVIFFADLDRLTGVFAWKPGEMPFLIAQSGGFLNIDGIDELVIDVMPVDASSPYHDALSDDGYLGLIVLTLDPEGPFGISSRLVLAQVPEPTMGGLALLSVLPLLRRRRG